MISQENIKLVLEEVANRHRLTPIRKVEGGDQGNTLYLFEDNEESKLVVKFGNDKEVGDNVKGYEALRKIGLEDMLPQPLIFEEIEGVPLIIMEYVGVDFRNRVSEEQEPVKLYSSLVNLMDPLYTQSLTGNGQESRLFLEARKEKLIGYSKLFGDVFSTDQLEMVEGVRIPENLNESCFAVFDFTPDNVFIKDGKIRYIDPKDEVLGNPILELAAFAGVSRDRYLLAGSVEGHEIIRDYALNELADKLKMESQDAELVWNLGRATQCLLSARFHSEPSGRKKFAVDSMEYMEMLQ